ncbi:AAA family ATPase [Anaeroselena agilis]|uniref:Response regulator n=1 Tax=Anaeroselena agilis TaxID=3063788 RepID=A0ABU3P3R1_9FIRM|nr:response regulator [Selenomonadales bacterium 4137-cl]
MAAKIKVLIVDDVEATRDSIRKLLAFDPDIAAVDQAGTAEEAIAKARAVQPEVILMDINMPGMDGLSATALLGNEVPNACVIIMSVQGEQEYLRRAMLAGAKDYLIKPFTGDELRQAIKQVHASEQNRRKVIPLEARQPAAGKVITVFSTKGGVGKTTIATNLAVALGTRSRQKVCIVDADLTFGDVSLFLNVLPRATAADLAADGEALETGQLSGYLTRYDDYVDVLAAPLRPEQAELVTAAHLGAALKALRGAYRYVIVDTAPSFGEAMLTALDEADQILVISSLDLPTIKNVKLCLEIMDSLAYSGEKVKLVLNRATGEGGMDVREVEESLRRPFAAVLPSDGKVVVPSVNRGIPFVVTNPEAGVSQGIFNLAKGVAGEAAGHEEPRGVVHRLKRLLG